MHIKYLFLIAILSILLVNCSSHIVTNNLLLESYTSARHKLQDRSYKKAIKQLEILYNYYTLGTYTQQVQLDLMYAYYQLSQLKMSNTIIDSFLRTNPNHPNIDYVLYIRGLISMALDKKTLPKLLGFGLNYSEHNPEYAHAAVCEFQQLMVDHPYSKYAIDAKKHLIYLKDRLASYELSIVKFYHQKQAYAAVVNRVKEMLRHFPDSHSTYQALPYMKSAYQRLQLNSQVELVKHFAADNICN